MAQFIRNIFSTSEDDPISLFDSGVGGLTVLKVLKTYFPYENFLYLGDTARLPYGTKSPDTIRQYLDQCIHFLLKQKVKAIVIACNSASSVFGSLYNSYHLPIYDVIKPGAQNALATTKTQRIGVIATRATVSANAYANSIHEINSQTQVFQQACPLLVPLVEEGWIDDPITRLIVYRYLNPLQEVSIDTLIMGCTHYPILKDSISKVMGTHVQLIDSGEAVALNLKNDFQKEKIIPRSMNKEEGKIHLLNTDLNPQIQIIAQKILSPFSIHSFQHVDVNTI